MRLDTIPPVIQQDNTAAQPDMVTAVKEVACVMKKKWRQSMLSGPAMGRTSCQKGPKGELLPNPMNGISNANGAPLRSAVQILQEDRSSAEGLPSKEHQAGAPKVKAILTPQECPQSRTTKLLTISTNLLS
jgi:hypothetical protein